jgi:hypothetical protein
LTREVKQNAKAQRRDEEKNQLKGDREMRREIRG